MKTSDSYVSSQQQPIVVKVTTWSLSGKCSFAVVNVCINRISHLSIHLNGDFLKNNTITPPESTTVLNIHD